MWRRKWTWQHSTRFFTCIFHIRLLLLAHLNQHNCSFWYLYDVGSKCRSPFLGLLRNCNLVVTFLDIFQRIFLVKPLSISNFFLPDNAHNNFYTAGNCNFDHNFCFWKNDLNFIFKWTPQGDRAPKYQTGPSGDHTSGTVDLIPFLLVSWRIN